MSLSVQLYASQPLPRTFTLAGNPYENEDARKQLHDMGVFFYRDENNVRGVVLRKNVLGPAYYGQTLLDDTSETGELTVDEWEPSNFLIEDDEEDAMSGVAISKVARKERTDLYAWAVHNELRMVLSYTNSAVTLKE